MCTIQDISGYTELSERLFQGEHGPDAISTVLNEVFGVCVRDIYDQGGDIIQWAGDAIVAFWPAARSAVLPRHSVTSASSEGSTTVHSLPATGDARIGCVRAAFALQSHVPALRFEPFPSIKLGMRVAASFGEVSLVHVGSPRQSSCVLDGWALHEVKRCEALCSPGQVYLSPSLWRDERHKGGGGGLAGDDDADIVISTGKRHGGNNAGGSNTQGAKLGYGLARVAFVTYANAPFFAFLVEVFAPLLASGNGLNFSQNSRESNQSSNGRGSVSSSQQGGGSVGAPSSATSNGATTSGGGGGGGFLSRLQRGSSFGSGNASPAMSVTSSVDSLPFALDGQRPAEAAERSTAAASSSCPVLAECSSDTGDLVMSVVQGYGFVNWPPAAKVGATNTWSVPEDPRSTSAAITSYVPRPVLQHVESINTAFLVSEVRTVTTVFINVQCDGATAEAGSPTASLGTANRGEGRLRMINQVYTAITDLVARYGGQLNKFTTFDKGPTFVIVFGLPPKHEDDHQRAMRTACEILLEMRTPRFEGIRCGVGISTGPAFCGVVGIEHVRQEYTVFGDDVNLAARLMGIDCRDGIICAESTLRGLQLAGGTRLPRNEGDRVNVTEAMEIRYHSDVKVKGKAQPVTVCALSPVDLASDTRLSNPGTLGNDRVAARDGRQSGVVSSRGSLDSSFGGNAASARRASRGWLLASRVLAFVS